MPIPDGMGISLTKSADADFQQAEGNSDHSQGQQQEKPSCKHGRQYQQVEPFSIAHWLECYVGDDRVWKEHQEMCRLV